MTNNLNIEAVRNFYQNVSEIQSTLKAPKSQFNKFGNYAYRNSEDILEAVKPLLSKFGYVLTVNDEIVMAGDRFYIKATATISDGMFHVTNSAFAREALDQKGMNDAQITGSTSSYARKYALNGLFCIDDTKDADATNTHGKDAPAPTGFTQKVKAMSENVGNVVNVSLDDALSKTTTMATPAPSFRRAKSVAPVSTTVSSGDDL